MMAAVRARRFAPTDHNEADALVLFLWATEHQDGEMKIPTSPYRCPLGPMQPERRDRIREARGPAIAAHPRRCRGRPASRHHGTAIHPTVGERHYGAKENRHAEWNVDTVAERFVEAAETARRLPPVWVARLLHPVAGIRRQPWDTWSASDIESRPLLPPPPPSSGCWGRWAGSVALGRRTASGLDAGRNDRVESDGPALRVRADRGVAGAEGASDRSRRAQHGNVAKFCQNTYYDPMSSMNISLPRFAQGLCSPAARPMKPTWMACVAASVNVLKGEA